MFDALAVSDTHSRPRVTRRATSNAPMIAIAVGILISSVHPSAAQAPAVNPAPGVATWEFRVTSGALIGTGTQRNSIKDARVTAAQLSFVPQPSLAITGTFGWATSRELTSLDTPKLDVFTYDLGIEARPMQWLVDRAVTFSPFVGVGAGARSYNFRSLDVDATNNLAAYATAGGELGVGRVGLRLEVRDYATGFKPLVGTGASDARNDVVIMAAVRFNRHHASQH
ncbi:MAG: hypothetical protein ABIT20_26450 [Gemmatimonadaceae bacterium]